MSIIERAGFIIERVPSFTTLLLPALAASRVARRRSGTAFNPTDELRISAFLNELCERALDIERVLIRSGASFPVGSSLLLVARRPENR
jgi:hypothetical protein